MSEEVEKIEDEQFSDWVRICKIPGRMICHNEGKCSKCTYATMQNNFVM